jgi:predicted ATPase
MAEPTLADPHQPRPLTLVPVRGRKRLGTTLPASLTSFVGREREVAAVADLLRRGDVRLLTLTGPGGVGKTRIAIRVAEELTTDPSTGRPLGTGQAFPNGATFVDLTPVAGPDLVAPTVAAALGVRDTGDRPVADRLADALRDRALLLVLDNFEHLAAGH